MRARNIVLACLPIFLICLTIVPNVQAQTATISNLKHPTEAVLQNGVAEATVTFTVSYADLPPGDYLTFGVLNGGTSNYVTGSGSSAPDPCISLAGSAYANSAFCANTLSTSSGTESASFILRFNSTQQYNLNAFAGVVDKSFQAIQSSFTVQAFSISITPQTVSTTTSHAVSSTSTTSNPSSGPFGIPGFQLETIILGVALGFGLLVAIRRRSKPSSSR